MALILTTLMAGSLAPTSAIADMPSNTSTKRVVSGEQPTRIRFGGATVDHDAPADNAWCTASSAG